MVEALGFRRRTIEKQGQEAAGGCGNQQEEEDCESETDERRANAAGSGGVAREHGEQKGQEREADIAGNVEFAAGGHRRRKYDDGETRSRQRNHDGPVEQNVSAEF